uniref:Uncharacterized protein n=1 Tax=Romanomermis culicivorax TaxID=13658 RepID=A0A915KJS9_ROMCU
MTLLKLEEHPTLKGCFVFASRNEDVYFVLQRGGKLRIVSDSLTNQSLNVQDLLCFNYKQTLTTPEYPYGCNESTFLIHKSNQDIIRNLGDTPTSSSIH